MTLESASDLYSRAQLTLARLFGPMSARLEKIDPLTRVDAPTAEDVGKLASLAGDPRTLGYFFGRLEGPGWLHALADHTLLQPPNEGPWFAYGYIGNFAQSHPGNVRDWLNSRPSGPELSDHQAFLLIAVARAVAVPVADAVLHVADGRTGDAGVLHQIAGYFQQLTAEEHTNNAVIGLVKRALDGVTGGGSPADDTYLSAAMLRVALSGAGQGHAKRWLGILVAKLAAACGHHQRELRLLQTIDGHTLSPDAPVLDQLATAVRDVARLAASEGVPTGERVERLHTLPAPLASRMIAAHLIDTVDADATPALALIAAEVASENPMPETLALLRALTDRQLPDLEQRMLQALGDPPSAEEVAALEDEAELPHAWTHAYGWLIAMPATVKTVWASANACVEARWGRALPNGHFWPAPSVMHLPPRAAVGTDELAALDPLAAAQRVGAWRPTGEFAGASRYDAGRELQETVSRDPATWLSASQAPILEALGDATYAERYLNALADHADQLHDHLPAILDAAEFAESKLTTPPTPGEHDNASWGNVLSAAIELIGKLAAAGAALDDNTERGWALIERAARRRDEQVTDHEETDNKPLEHAIYRRSMRALDNAFVYAHATLDGDAEPQRLLELLDEALKLEPPDGLHARAIIGPRLSWLAGHAPE